MLFASLALSLLVPQEPLESPTSSRGGLDWFEGTYAEALAVAAAEDRPLLIEFRADWCGWCRKHETENLTDERVARALDDYVLFGADLSLDEGGAFRHAEPAALMKRFRIRRFPALVVVRPDDRAEDLVSGYLPAEPLLRELARIGRGEQTVSDWERRMAEEPTELEWRYRYALKLGALGDQAGYDRELAHIVAADPEGTSLPRRRMTLMALREKLWGCMRDPAVEPDPAELTAFLANETHPELLTDGWLLMGTVEAELGRLEASRRSLRRAWEHVPERQVASVGNAIAWALWSQREQLGEDDRSFALQVSLRATRAFERICVDDAALAQYYDTLACCYYMNGKRAKAIRLTRQCIEWSPGAGFEERLELFESRG